MKLLSFYLFINLIEGCGSETYNSLKHFLSRISNTLFDTKELCSIGVRAGGGGRGGLQPPQATEITGFFGLNAHDSGNDT